MPATEYTHNSQQRTPWVAQQRLHLLAAALTRQAPRAEVLAVVGEKAVIVLSKPRRRAPYDFRLDVPCLRARLDAKAEAVGKTCKSRLFDWAATQEAFEPDIVHHLAVSDIDAMVDIATAVRLQMCARRNFLGDFR